MYLTCTPSVIFDFVIFEIKNACCSGFFTHFLFVVMAVYESRPQKGENSSRQSNSICGVGSMRPSCVPSSSELRPVLSESRSRFVRVAFPVRPSRVPGSSEFRPQFSHSTYDLRPQLVRPCRIASAITIIIVIPFQFV